MQIKVANQSEKKEIGSSVSKRNIIEIKKLNLEFPLRMGTIHAVNNADFDVQEGKVTALVGESGSGKSTLASAILKIVSSPGIITSGEIRFQGENILEFDKDKLQKYRWERVSMVFQAAQNALNPVMTIKDQIIETVHSHNESESVDKIIEKASQLLKYVRLEPEHVLPAYPHELSGGMKQRVMIAFSLLLDPKVIILDEPTTALDVITQEYIFEILQQLHNDLGITMLLLTHDISVVAKVADRVGVMYAGIIVEVGEIHEIFKNPRHPYTIQLLKAVPSLLDDVREYIPVSGEAIDLFNLPSGCPFNPRCPYASDECKKEMPDPVSIGKDHNVLCYRVENISGGGESKNE